MNGSTNPGDWCQETFAWGLRNPYRFAFDPNTPGRLYINDVGQALREEIDQGSFRRRLRLEPPGGDLRQPCAGARQLRQPDARRDDQPDIRLRPQRGVRHDHRRRVRAQRHQLAGRVHGQVPVRRLRVRKDLPSRSQRPERHPSRLRHEPRIRSTVHLEFGPFGSTQALYYTSYAGGGEVRRINYGPQSIAPGTPAIGSAVAGNGQATVSWTAPASDGGSPIIGYVVVVYIGYSQAKVRIFNSPSTTQTVTGLTNGTTYRFRVRAYNAVGFSDYSTASNPVTPGP